MYDLGGAFWVGAFSGLAGLVSYVLLLPYMLVMLQSRCYRARFERIFRIGGAASVPELPATEETL